MQRSQLIGERDSHQTSLELPSLIGFMMGKRLVIKEHIKDKGVFQTEGEVST